MHTVLIVNPALNNRVKLRSKQRFVFVVVCERGWREVTMGGHGRNMLGEEPQLIPSPSVSIHFPFCFLSSNFTSHETPSTYDSHHHSFVLSCCQRLWIRLRRPSPFSTSLVPATRPDSVIVPSRDQNNIKAQGRESSQSQYRNTHSHFCILIKACGT